MTAASAPHQPNLILITTDQQRFDTLHCGGADFMRTPHVDQLAAEGVRFTNAYADCPICIPSRTTIMNGRHAFSYGRAFYQDGVELPVDPRASLPGILTAAGYQTQAIGKMHFFPPRARYGFENTLLPERYYETMSQHFRDVGRPMHHGIGQNEIYPTLATVPESFTLTAWTVDQCIEFIQHRDPTAPFFLWCSFGKPHPPFDPPEPYYSMYRGADLPDEVHSDWSRNAACPYNIRFGREVRKQDQTSPQLRRAAREAYYGLVTQIDHHIGRLLGCLNNLQLRANTGIVFCSDHGDLLGDHGAWGKVWHLEGSAHIPMVVRFPDTVANRPVNATCATPVTLADLLPTFGALGGAKIPKTIDGADLLPFVRGRASRDYLRLEAENQSIALTDGVEKYIWYPWPGQEHFFDLKKDPYERKNLGPALKNAARLKRWRARAVQHLIDSGRKRADTWSGLPIVTKPYPSDADIRKVDSTGLHIEGWTYDVLH
ncbi:MAG: sulfatase-like hydrolase/transferase [Planctomycetota bacterium]